MRRFTREVDFLDFAVLLVAGAVAVAMLGRHTLRFSNPPTLHTLNVLAEIVAHGGDFGDSEELERRVNEGALSHYVRSFDNDTIARFVVSTVILRSLSFAAPLTVAVIVIQLRHPRPSLRRLLRKPGMAACCAATSAMLVAWVAGASFALHLTAGRWHGRVVDLTLSFLMPPVMGTCVCAVWTVMALRRNWRPNSSRLDRWGRVAAYWMAMTIAGPWASIQ